MDKWDDYLEDEGKVRTVMDGHNLILFFQKDGELFGAPEESRVTFARLKNPEPDDAPGFQDEASFIALNLIDALIGKMNQSVFGFKDLPKIKILDREDCEKKLHAKAKGSQPAVGKNLGDKQGDDDGLIKITDEE
jgi:hypothetical protein